MKFVIAAIAVLTTSIGASAAPTNGNKCTSPQAVCALQNGGKCDPQTGRWGIGGYEWGGSHAGWLQCLGDIYSKRLNGNAAK